MRIPSYGTFTILFAHLLCGCKEERDEGTASIPEGAPIRIDRGLPRSKGNHEYEDILNKRIEDSFRSLLRDFASADGNAAQIGKAIDNNALKLSAVEKEMNLRFPNENSKTKAFIEIWRRNLKNFELNSSPQPRPSLSALSADDEPDHKQELVHGILKTSEKVTDNWPLIYVDSGLWDASLEARISELEVLHVRMHYTYPKRRTESRRMIDDAKKRIRGLKVGPNWNIQPTAH